MCFLHSLNLSPKNLLRYSKVAENIPMVEEELFFVWCFFKILDVYCIPTFAPNHPQLTYLLFCSTLMEETHLALHTVVNLLFSNYSSKEHIFSFIRDGPGVFDIHLMIP